MSQTAPRLDPAPVHALPNPLSYKRFGRDQSADRPDIIARIGPAQDPIPAVDAKAVSIIVPALNEAENLPSLLARIDAALRPCLDGQPYEVLIIDDNSRDNTQTVCADLAARYPLSLIVREHPTNGLSGAVLYGMALAHGKILAVMDADLQHPPERLPDLIEAVRSGDSDFALGSRYAAGGSTETSWGLLRKLNSWSATLLARPFAGGTHDPMSGFFALTSETYQRARRLTPLGYKIALELMCKCRVQKVREIPIHFALRTHGQSKLSITQQFRYLEHLSRLYDFTFPRASPIAKFLIASGISWLVGLALTAFCLLTGLPGPQPAATAAAVIIGYAAAIGALAIFHARYVRTQRAFILSPRPWTDFWLIAALEWLACAFTATWLSSNLRAPSLPNLCFLSFTAATLTRYILRKEFLQDVRGLRKNARRDDPQF